VSNLLKVVRLQELMLVYYAYSIMQYGIVFWGASEVALPKLYYAVPAEIRSIRAYKRFVTARCKFVYEHRYYSAKEYFDAADVA
jgi:hypothetical protein